MNSEVAGRCNGECRWAMPMHRWKRHYCPLTTSSVTGTVGARKAQITEGLIARLNAWSPVTHFVWGNPTVSPTDTTTSGRIAIRNSLRHTKLRLAFTPICACAPNLTCPNSLHI